MVNEKLSNTVEPPNKYTLHGNNNIINSAVMSFVERLSSS